MKLRPNWLIAISRYLVAIAIGNLLWETAQMPLYTLWHNGSPRSILWAVLHCTAGDLVIATVALTAALGTVGSPRWPRDLRRLHGVQRISQYGRAQVMGLLRMDADHTLDRNRSSATGAMGGRPGVRLSNGNPRWR